MNTEISATRLVIVEGKDDAALVGEFANHLSLPDFQILPIGGNTQIKGGLAAIVRAPKFDQVTSLGIIVDADLNPGGVWQSVQHHLAANGLPRPSGPFEVLAGALRVGVFLCPGPGRSGALEDLCLAAVADAPDMSCVDEFFNCLGRELDEISKRKTQVYLSATPERVPAVGLAARKRYWPFEHEAFAPLRDFLTLLAG